MDFNALVHAISDIHQRTQRSAVQAVDAALTFRKLNLNKGAKIERTMEIVY